MNIIQYLNETPGLGTSDLTVSAQGVSPNDGGALTYNVFFPLTNVRSTKLKDIRIGQYRPVADRREWNAPGRLIPVRLPNTADITIIPVESYFTVGEEEIQTLVEETDNDEGLILRRIGASIPERTDGLALANWRRVELDAYELWTKNQVTQKDPQTGRSVVTSFLMDSTRYQQALTTWTTTTAYANFLAWLRDANAAVSGGVSGAQMSLTQYNMIREAAPAAANGYIPMRSDVEARITDEIGRDFRFVTNDNTVDPFTDGGTATTSERVWPLYHIAAIPVGGRVGITAKAPVVRAAELAREFGEEYVDRNGVAVYYDSLNEGKGAKVSAQLNTLSIPEETKVYVMNTVQA